MTIDLSKKDQFTKAALETDAQREAEQCSPQETTEMINVEHKRAAKEWEAGRKWSGISGKWMTKDEYERERHQEELRLARDEVNVQHVLVALIAGALLTLAILSTIP